MKSFVLFGVLFSSLLLTTSSGYNGNYRNEDYYSDDEDLNPDNEDYEDQYPPPVPPENTPPRPPPFPPPRTTPRQPPRPPPRSPPTPPRQPRRTSPRSPPSPPRTPPGPLPKTTKPPPKEPDSCKLTKKLAGKFDCKAVSKTKSLCSIFCIFPPSLPRLYECNNGKWSPELPRCVKSAAGKTLSHPC